MSELMFAFLTAALFQIFIVIPMKREIDKLSRHFKNGRVLVGHALELGHLGDGSTKGWAEGWLKETEFMEDDDVG